MKFIITVFLSLILLSTYGQNKVRMIIKKKNGIEISREEFNSNGKIIFKKETPTYFMKEIKDSLNKYKTSIDAFIFDSLNNIQFEISANTMTGYYIKKYNHDEQDHIEKVFTFDDGYFSTRNFKSCNLFFLFSINNFTEFIANSKTQTRLKNGSFCISIVKQYNAGRIAKESDSENVVDYFYSDNSIKTRTKTTNSCIENIKVFDKYLNIIREVRIDSNSHFAIQGKDTSEIVTYKYDNRNQKIEEHFKEVWAKNENYDKKIFYTYTKDCKLSKVETVNFNGDVIREIIYKYKNGLLVKEVISTKNIINGSAITKREAIKYYYDYFK
jgi:hypothetical protein